MKHIKLRGIFIPETGLVRVIVLEQTHCERQGFSEFPYMGTSNHFTSGITGMGHDFIIGSYANFAQYEEIYYPNYNGRTYIYLKGFQDDSPVRADITLEHWGLLKKCVEEYNRVHA